MLGVSKHVQINLYLLARPVTWEVGEHAILHDEVSFRNSFETRVDASITFVILDLFELSVSSTCPVPVQL